MHHFCNFVFFFSFSSRRRFTSLRTAADYQHLLLLIDLSWPPEIFVVILSVPYPITIKFSHDTEILNQIHFLSNGLICRLNLIDQMALTNLILTVAGVSAVILLMRSDVKQSASIFKRNVRQIRHWLEEESASAAKYSFITHKLFRSLDAWFIDSCVILSI